MERAYRYRMYPNAIQRETIAKTLGCCRWVYNRCIEERKTSYERTGKSPSTTDTVKMIPGWKAENPWMGEADYTALQQAARDCGRAFENFFRRCRQGGKPGYPRFKSKRDGQQSYRTQNSRGRSAVEVDAAGNRVKLPKLGLVKCKVSRPPQGRIVSATVSRTPTGKYFVSICCVDCPEPQMPPASSPSVGIDLGIKEEVVYSTGEVVESPKALRRYERKLAREQRRLSRKVKGSKNRGRQRLRVARVHERVANQRRDFVQKATTQLVRENQAVCCEDLNARGMMTNRHLAKSVADAAFGEVVRELEYKCSWYGRELVKVSRWYPSSKTCSSCGHVQDMPLSARTYKCPECGMRMDRDLNAAVNIEREGLRILNERNGTAGCAGTGDETSRKPVERA